MYMVFPHEAIVTKAGLLTNQIMQHLYALYGVGQSTTCMPMLNVNGLTVQ